MTSQIQQCAFCGDPDPARLTSEHLWPRWSHKEINRSMRRWHGLYGVHRIERNNLDSSGLKTRKKGGNIHDMQVKCVCGGDARSRNNGWMREFENQARPVLVPLMNGIQTRLSPEQQKIVAGWAAMKAMVAEYASFGHVTTTQAERDRMRAIQLPPEHGWGIWIGHYERLHWPGHLGTVSFTFWPEPERAHLSGVPTTDFNGQSSFQVVKKLFIQIIRCRAPELVEEWRFDARATHVIRKIWPTSAYSFAWPPPTMSDLDADYVASALPMAGMKAVRRRLERNGGA